MLHPTSTAHFHIITDHDPVRVQYQSATVSDDEYRAFLDGQSATLRDAAMRNATGQAERVLMISDAVESASLTSTQRRMQAEWISRHEDQLRLACLVTYAVIPNAIRRGFMTAILWLAETPIEVVACGSLEEAAVRAVERARREGIRVPFSLQGDPGGAVRRSVDQTLAAATSARRTA